MDPMINTNKVKNKSTGNKQNQSIDQTVDKVTADQARELMFEGNNKWTNSDVIEFNRLVEKIRQAAYHGNNKVCHICSTNKQAQKFLPQLVEYGFIVDYQTCDQLFQVSMTIGW